MTTKITKEEIQHAINNSNSMAGAASILKLHFSTFKRYAKKYNLYATNQGGKGIKKKSGTNIPLQEILEGKHPQYQTYKLKLKMIKSNVIKNICSQCGISNWNNLPLNMELDHIDGDRTNHLRTNLRMLCPNCHAQTDTYRSKNIKNK